MEVIIKFLGYKENILGNKSEFYLQVEDGKFLTTSKIECATVYGSIRAAQKATERKSFLEWSMNNEFKHEIVEIPSKRLELEPDERIIFFNDGSMFQNGKLGVWEQIAVKEINYIEATKLLVKSISINENPTFYFWGGSFHDGSIKTLYGIAAESREKFVVNHFLGGFMTTSHCGKYRIVNSGYRMPVKLPSGEIQWVNSREYFELIKNGIMEKKDAKPAFETDLNLDEFFAKVDEVARKY